MGCDIHVNFETRDADGRWSLTFEPTPEPIWWESIVDKKINDGTGAVMTGTNDWKTQYDYLNDHFRSLDLDEAVEKYGNDRGFGWNYNLPCLNTTGRVAYPEIDQRDYGFFGRINNVRSGPALFETDKGVPEDSCREIVSFLGSYGSDGHSHSWLMVADLIKHPSLVDFEQIKWLKTFIPDPENTRMVFFFDN